MAANSIYVCLMFVCVSLLAQVGGEIDMMSVWSIRIWLVVEIGVA